MRAIRFMRRVSLWRSTSFRLAVTVMLAAVLSFAAVTMISRQIIVARVQALQDQRVQALFGVVEQQAKNSGVFGLEDAIVALLQQEGTERAAILLSDASGRVLGGNMPLAALPDGWVDLPGAAFGNHVGAYRFFTGPVGPLRLSVGLSNDSVTAVRETTGRALAWAAVSFLYLPGGAHANRELHSATPEPRCRARQRDQRCRGSSRHAVRT
jgi:hypothetical protein